MVCCPEDSGLLRQLLAGIGSIESGHGTSGGASADPETGEVVPHIFGIPLDGSPGIEKLPVGKWLGWFGLGGPWQQAVGPMQFLPGTFEAWAVDQDGDGVTNPHDIDDAVATAANYLCGGRTGAITDERAAVRRYNNDGSYVTRVIEYADQIGSGDEIAILCPVAGPTTFTNTWLAPRSGGRQHKGVDIFADERTPVVAPVAGDVELAEDSLGGLAFHLWGDDGNYFYGAHLAGFARYSGRVTAGEVLGYVGHTGNAAETAPHLHFEIPRPFSRRRPEPRGPHPLDHQGLRRLPIVVERVTSGSTPLDAKDPVSPSDTAKGRFATPDEGLSHTQRHEGASGGVSVARGSSPRSASPVLPCDIWHCRVGLHRQRRRRSGSAMLQLLAST